MRLLSIRSFAVGVSAGQLMRLVAMLWIAAVTASAATSYIAANLQPPNSPYQIANVYELNNQGQVLVDICANGDCFGANRLLGVLSNGVITPLPFPAGYTYSPNGLFYHINDSGTVVMIKEAENAIAEAERHMK